MSYQEQPPLGHQPMDQQYTGQQPVMQQPMGQQPMQTPLPPFQGSEKHGPHEWQNNLCNCSPCDSCLLACCLPSLLVGRAAERLRNYPSQDIDYLNNDCLIHAALTYFTGCGWIYVMLKRGEYREQFGIEGSQMEDCCASYWCHCCAVIQHDNEVKARLQAAGPIRQGYQPNMDMIMPAPPAETHHNGVDGKGPQDYHPQQQSGVM